MQCVAQWVHRNRSGTERLWCMEKKTKSIGVMTSDQAIQLRQLAFDAYEPDAFSPNLTRTEAERRIAALQAKLRLMDDPPHVQ